jgi:tetratricopeptide (TPR) repeat protein
MTVLKRWLSLIPTILVAVIVLPSMAISQGDLNVLTTNAFRSLSFQEASRLAQDAWNAYESGKDKKQAGIAAANLGAMDAVYGRLGKAQDWQAEARKILSNAGDPSLLGRLGVAEALTNFLDAHQYSHGESDDAIANLEEARKSIDGQNAIFDVCEAEILGNSNDGQRVTAGYMKYMGMISACEASGNSLLLAQCLMRLGKTEGGTGGHATAERNFTRALGIYEAAGDVNQSMVASRNIGLARWKQKKLEPSAEILKKTLVRAQAENSPRTALLILNDLSMLHTALGESEEAITHDRAADDLLLSIAADIKSGKCAARVLTYVEKGSRLTVSRLRIEEGRSRIEGGWKEAWRLC